MAQCFGGGVLIPGKGQSGRLIMEELASWGCDGKQLGSKRCENIRDRGIESEVVRGEGRLPQSVSSGDSGMPKK